MFLAAFFAMSVVDGLNSSFLVFCGSPSTRITAPSTKFWPVRISFFPLTRALTIVGGSSDWAGEAA